MLLLLTTASSVWNYKNPFQEVPPVYELAAALHTGHHQRLLVTDLASVKALGVFPGHMDGKKIDGEQSPTSPVMASCDSSVQAVDQKGQHAAGSITQAHDVFALPMHATYRRSKVFLTLLAFFALSTFVTLAHPSGPVFWGTYISGTVSTLCSYVVLQLPTGVEGEHRDLDLIITNKRCVPCSTAGSDVFCV